MQNGSVTEDKLTFASCAICGSDEYSEICEIEISPISTPSKLVRCERCGFRYANPRLKREFEEEYYRRHYHENQGEGYWYDGRIDVFKRALREIGSFSKKGRLIDVGCGMGYFMDLARNDGWEVSGVEISDHAIDHAKRKLKLDVIKGGLEEAHFSERHFDAATMWNVLDQVYDPNGSLIELNRILKIGARVFIRVTNVDFHLTLFKLCNRLKAMIPIDTSIFTFHLYSFDKVSIKKFLESTGFSEVIVRTEHIGVNALPVPGFMNIFGQNREKAARMVLDMGAKAINYLSLGNIIMSPSIFVIAKKEKNI